jgi:hypothetical protein
MMTDSKSCETAYDRTIAKLEVAGRTHDPVAMIALFSSDIIVRSPITQRIRFEGIEQATDLFHRVFKHISDIRFYKVIGAGSDEQVIFWRGRVGNVYLEDDSVYARRSRFACTSRRARAIACAQQRAMARHLRRRSAETDFGDIQSGRAARH